MFTTMGSGHMSPIKHNTFEERLRALMDERGLGVRQLARDLDVSPTTVSGWLAGARPRRDALLKLCKHFGKSEEYFYAGVDSSNNHVKSMAAVARGVRKALRDKDIEMGDDEFERLIRLVYEVVETRQEPDVSLAAERYAKEMLSLVLSH